MTTKKIANKLISPVQLASSLHIAIQTQFRARLNETIHHLMYLHSLVLVMERTQRAYLNYL